MLLGRPYNEAKCKWVVSGGHGANATTAVHRTDDTTTRSEVRARGEPRMQVREKSPQSLRGPLPTQLINYPEFAGTSSNSADQLRSLGPKSDYDKDQKTEVSMFSVLC